MHWADFQGLVINIWVRHCCVVALQARGGFAAAAAGEGGEPPTHETGSGSTANAADAEIAEVCSCMVQAAIEAVVAQNMG